MIMENRSRPGAYHVPVLVERVLEYLITNLKGVYVDGTLGGGGHAEAILERLDDDGKLIGMDRDEEAVAYSGRLLERYGDRIEILHDRFGCVAERLDGKRIDGFLLDLGVSSHQLDAPERGFSYASEGPLDCRMDAGTGQRAEEVVNSLSADALADVLFVYGEERASRRIARAVVEMRKKKPLVTTTDLAEAVRRVIPPRWQTKSLSRVFQALRIYVNREMEELASALSGVVDLLNPGGRMVVISYHSLEDRMVKRFYRGEGASFRPDDVVGRVPDLGMRVLTRRPIRPTEDEVTRNSRSRSARLRAAEKIETGRRLNPERGIP